jgi:hypothetical protein
MNLKLKLLITITFATSSSMIFADTGSGVYFDVGAGFSDVSPLPNKGAAIGADVGYLFNPYYGLELGVNVMPSTQWNNNLLNSYNVYNIALRGQLPLGKIFSLYGKLGLGVASSNWSGDFVSMNKDSCNGTYQCTNSSATDLIGVGTFGISFKLNDKLSLYLENNNYQPLTNNGGFGYSYNGLFGVHYEFGA